MTKNLNDLLNRYSILSSCQEDILNAYALLQTAYQQNKKLLVCGNGGSAGDSEHIVGELMKGFVSKRPLPEEMRQKFKDEFDEDGIYLANHLQGALPAISLVSHSALISAFNNDVSDETVFAQQVYGYGQPGDVLLAISTSGNSKNIVRAVQVASVLGLKCIALTGKSGGKLKTLCNVSVVVPKNITHEIQELHLPIYHAWCIALEEYFFGNFDNSQQTRTKKTSKQSV